jgi:hypothetical protein
MEAVAQFLGANPAVFAPGFRLAGKWDVYGQTVLLYARSG